MRKFFKVTILLSIIICFLAFLVIKMKEVIHFENVPNVGTVDAQGNLCLTRYEDLQEYYPSLVPLVEDDYLRLYNLAISCADSYDISGKFTIKNEELLSYWMQANMAVNDVLVQANMSSDGTIYVNAEHHSDVDDTPFDVYAKAVAKVIGVKEGQLIAAAKSLYDGTNTKEFIELKYDGIHGNIHYVNGTCRYYFTFEK